MVVNDQVRFWRYFGGQKLQIHEMIAVKVKNIYNKTRKKSKYCLSKIPEKTWDAVFF